MTYVKVRHVCCYFIGFLKSNDITANIQNGGRHFRSLLEAWQLRGGNIVSFGSCSDVVQNETTHRCSRSTARNIQIRRNTMRMTRLMTVLGSALAVTLLSSQVQARDLTIVGWGGSSQAAQDEAFFKPYQEESGKKLLTESYNGELAKVKAMVESGDVTWDLVVMEAPELENACDEGIVEPIEWDKLGGEEQMLPDAVMGECGVGAYVWSNVLAYDKAKLGEDGPKTWADFWNVEKWPGKRALRKSAKVSLEIALLADGVPAADVYKTLATKEGVDRAFKKLGEIKEHIQWWESGAQPPQWLAAGDVVMTSAYSGRIATAVDEGRDFATVWDGQIYAIDGWALVKGSPNKEQAYDFLKVANDPEKQVVFASKIPYGPTHKDAVSKAPADVTVRLPTNPDYLKNAVSIDTDFWIENVEELSQRFNNWASQ